MKHRNAFAVGGTVLVALLIVVAGAIWLGHVQLGSRPEKVTVRFRTVGGMGVYEDTLVKTKGEWLIQKREILQ